MSLFDPHSLYVNRQRKTKKGQVLQKKPVPLLRAYNGRDLQEAYRILNAYGIPYGKQPEPEPSPENLSKFDNTDLCYAISEVWTSPAVDQSIALLDRDILGMYLDTSEFGQFLKTELDPSKVTGYLCTISSKNITYYYDPAVEPRPGEPYTYQMQVHTQDRMSTYSILLNFYDDESPNPDIPNRYISKTMVNYTTDNSPHYVLEFNNLVGGTGFHEHVTEARNYTDAFISQKTHEDLPFSDLINLNFDATQLAETHPYGSWQHDTAACISTIANIAFYIEYTS